MATAGTVTLSGIYPVLLRQQRATAGNSGQQRATVKHSVATVNYRLFSFISIIYLFCSRCCHCCRGICAFWEKNKKNELKLNIMFHKANCKMEWKEKVRMNSYGLFFQGYWLRPCMGLNCWQRWGPYVFDEREVRRFLELEELPLESFTNNKFPERMTVLMRAVGDYTFLSVLKKTQKMVDLEYKAFVAENISKGITDGLNF